MPKIMGSSQGGINAQHSFYYEQAGNRAEQKGE
jgi:hypothetical protein